MKHMKSKRDLDKHTYKVILRKLREAGWDNQQLVKQFNDSPVSWIEAELSGRVK